MRRVSYFRGRSLNYLFPSFNLWCFWGYYSSKCNYLDLYLVKVACFKGFKVVLILMSRSFIRVEWALITKTILQTKASMTKPTVWIVLCSFGYLELLIITIKPCKLMLYVPIDLAVLLATITLLLAKKKAERGDHGCLYP